jgi:hypothetical protein
MATKTFTKWIKESEGALDLSSPSSVGDFVRDISVVAGVILAGFGLFGLIHGRSKGNGDESDNGGWKLLGGLVLGIAGTAIGAFIKKKLAAW